MVGKVLSTWRREIRNLWVKGPSDLRKEHLSISPARIDLPKNPLYGQEMAKMAETPHASSLPKRLERAIGLQ